MLTPVAFFLVELAKETRNFSLIQSEYLKECIKRSRPHGIKRTIITPETADAAVLQFRNNLNFLVRLFFEIMEGVYQTTQSKFSVLLQFIMKVLSLINNSRA